MLLFHVCNVPASYPKKEEDAETWEAITGMVPELAGSDSQIWHLCLPEQIPSKQLKLKNCNFQGPSLCTPERHERVIF